MYFIPRNNKLYNYIAHANLRRCYIATLFFLTIFGAMVFYGIYSPLCSHITLLKAERTLLQKKVDDIAQMEKSNKELTPLIESHKKNITDHAVAIDKRDEHCYKRMMFIMDTIAQEGLTLSSYGSCKERDKSWHIKDSAHFDVVGSLEKLLLFLDKIKNARQMITISHVTLTRVADNSFQMSFDVGLVTVKK
ncbi:MAG TPA: hypothetical protein VKU36_04930 [Candidatus Babeliales bacterium]|nr:hypothetical protein [Candidatus Babeliales bacterium]